MSDIIPPDPVLLRLYNSQRPAAELIPGVQLSPVLISAWLQKDAKVMLQETWQTPATEVEEGAPLPASFDPAAHDYNILVKRLSRSAPFQRFNTVMGSIRQKEADLLEIDKLPAKEREEKREEKSQQMEADKALLAEIDQQIQELKASFAEDPLSFVDWMNALFDVADAGLTTFDASGRFFPHTNLQGLFNSDNSSSFYQEAEQVLGMFKRRYERERGAGKVQIFTRLIPNQFQDGYSPQAVVEAIVDRQRQALYGADSSEALDLVQVFWWDLQGLDVESTLKALQKLCEDQVEVAEDGSVTITAPKKVKAVGLVDFPTRSIIQAVQAGVPVVSLSIPLSIADRRYQEALQTAKEYNIKVFARDGLFGGLVSEKYVGGPPPSTTDQEPDTDLDEVATSLDQVNNYGGWEKTQQLLKTIHRIAQKHGVKMQTVALRWQIDQGTFPVAPMRWGEQAWSQFGYYYWHINNKAPGVDAALFQVDSFLDMDDMNSLSGLGRYT